MDNPEYHVVGHADRWGGRVTSVPASAPSAVIPILGDSQTFGLGVRDDETFASVLSLKLGRRLLNLGLSGSGMDEQLHILVHRHEVLGAPGVWIFGFYAGNDLSDIVNEGALDASLAQRRGPIERVERAANAFVFHQTVLRHSHVLNLIKFGVIGAFAEAHIEMRDEAFVAFDRRREEFRARAAEAFGRRLDRIDELSRRLRFRPIFLIVPDAHQISPALLERGRRAYWLDADDLDVRYPNRLLRERLDARHIPLVDPTDCMANREDLYYREGHLNARGHAALAECAAAPLDAAIRTMEN